MQEIMKCRINQDMLIIVVNQIWNLLNYKMIMENERFFIKLVKTLKNPKN